MTKVAAMWMLILETFHKQTRIIHEVGLSACRNGERGEKYLLLSDNFIQSSIRLSVGDQCGRKSVCGRLNDVLNVTAVVFEQPVLQEALIASLCLTGCKGECEIIANVSRIIL